MNGCQSSRPVARQLAETCRTSVVGSHGSSHQALADGFTDRVRHEAHCCIARAAGRDERRYLWI